MRKFVKATINGVLRPLGYQVRRLGSPPRGFQNFFHYAKARGLNPATVIDVGVGHGTWELYEAFPAAKHVLIEPLRQVYEGSISRIVETYDADIYWVAAGSKHGYVDLHWSPQVPNKASAYGRTALTQEEETQTTQVEMRPLDSLPSYSPPYLLKVDTEGSDLEVLLGANSILQTTICVLLEASIAHRFNDGYSFSDAILLMRNFGFEAIDIPVIHQLGTHGPLLCADIAFVPVDSRVRPFLISDQS